MAKKQLYFAEAERLFITEGCSLEEIAGRINVSSRTLQEWKFEGDWDRKRSVFLKNTHDNYDDTLSLLRKLLKRAHEKLDKNEDPDATTLNFIREFMPSRAKIKSPDEVADAGKPAPTSNGALSDAAMRKIEELLGVR